jgi:hypothetical protein
LAFSGNISLGVFLGVAMGHGLPLWAQDAPQGPIAPLPEHHVTRIGNEAEPGAPPTIPEGEIIKRLAQKEEEYVLARTRYTYRKTIRIQEFGQDGSLPASLFWSPNPHGTRTGKCSRK